MGTHLGNLADLDDHPITAEDAAAVYRVLQENAEKLPWPIGEWLEQFEARWANGEDQRDLARLVVQTTYREREKRNLFCFPESPPLVEAQLDIFAAVGIEPPRSTSQGLSHGSGAQTD